jgi:molybdopterin converting factor small subunit
MIKRFLLFAALSLSAIPKLSADEGMWLPNLLEGMTITDMQSRGFKLTAEDIYSVNNTSLKDAICQFGGGCTAELISQKGLLLTNHHCGFSYIQMHSSVQNDYLTNGFWAMNQSEEKVCPGLTAMFIISMQDVTNEVLTAVKSSMTEAERNAAIQVKMNEMEKSYSKGTQAAQVRAFYYGNVFYMFMTETYTDVRMVGAPPMALGNFGGDTDNWVWPRHTADFSLFRIYAGADNKPAPYSDKNVPYVPKKSLSINAHGVKAGDFTLVYGFPGRTTEYLSSYGVDLVANVSDPVKVGLRTIRLDIMREEMAKSDVVRIQYASKRNGIANAWKKWQGEMIGLKQNDAIGKKQRLEADFTKRIAADNTLQQKYGTVLADMKTTHAEMVPWQQAGDYMNEGALSIEVVRYLSNYRKLVELSKATTVDQKELDATLKALREGLDIHFKDYNAKLDQRIAVAVCKEMDKGMAADKKPAVFQDVQTKNKGSWDKYFASIYAKTIFTKKEKVKALLDTYDATKWKTITDDPAYALTDALYLHFYSNILPRFRQLNDELNRLNRIYMEAQMLVFKEKNFYPDANSTLRITYGQVQGYPDATAKDGYMYSWYTTLDGLIAKDKNYPAVVDYVVPNKIQLLVDNKDYGRYADPTDGKIHTCFIASNHTTGGNSGSPVLDANGNLIGTNFDRVWEGTMSDISYDPTICRNISLDVRYTLFVIDKYAGAGYLLNEMNIKW